MNMEDVHSEIVDMLTEFIMEKGKRWKDDKMCNCWEAGMMKAVCMINEYFQEEEWDR